MQVVQKFDLKGFSNVLDRYEAHLFQDGSYKIFSRKTAMYLKPIKTSSNIRYSFNYKGSTYGYTFLDIKLWCQAQIRANPIRQEAVFTQIGQAGDSKLKNFMDAVGIKSKPAEATVPAAEEKYVMFVQPNMIPIREAHGGMVIMTRAEAEDRVSKQPAGRAVLVPLSAMIKPKVECRIVF